MIELHNIRFNRENFSLKIEELKIVEGTKTILVGASGSGKTTLLRILSGLEKRFEGEYRLDGIAKKDLGKLKERGIMFLSQDFLLWEHLNVIEHLNFVLNGGKSLKEHQESINFLKMVGLFYKKENKISQLSTGERQRLALARALSAKAKYLFLDEPFSNIDMVLAHELIEIINKYQNDKKFSVIFSSHGHLGFKKDSKIIILDNGKIIQKGKWENIKNKPNNKWIKKWVELVE